MINHRKPVIRPVSTKLTRLFTEFFQSEQSSGIILILCTLTAVIIASSSFGQRFIDFWHIKLGFESRGIFLSQTLEHWIHDGSLAIFFMLICLEIEREIYIGELPDLKSASLPIVAGVGAGPCRP